jgi:hypothetical protein
MRSDKTDRDALERELAHIEFPGEDEQWIRSYLAGRGFVDSVMRAVGEARIRPSRLRIWAGIALVNIVILVVAGTNPFLVEDVLALRNELFTFFFGFLGVTLAGCIVGVFLSLDFGRLEDLFRSLGRDVGSDKWRNLFRHPR